MYVVPGSSEDDIARIESVLAPPEWSELQQSAMLRWICARLRAETRAYLCSLPLRISIHLTEATPLTVFHAGPDNPTDNVHHLPISLLQ